MTLKWKVLHRCRGCQRISRFSSGFWPETALKSGEPLKKQRMEAFFEW